MVWLRAVPFGTLLSLRSIASQKYEAVLRRARIQGSQTFVSLDSRLESNEEENKGVAGRNEGLGGWLDTSGGRGSGWEAVDFTSNHS